MSLQQGVQVNNFWTEEVRLNDTPPFLSLELCRFYNIYNFLVCHDKKVIILGWLSGGYPLLSVLPICMTSFARVETKCHTQYCVF